MRSSGSVGVRSLADGVGIAGSAACALHCMAAALERNEAAIVAANQADVAAFQTSPKFSTAMHARLVLSPKKLKGVADGIRALASQPNPLGKTRRHVEISKGLTLMQETVPIGVLLVIFESRPDVLGISRDAFLFSTEFAPDCFLYERVEVPAARL